ncbi:sigma-70 family RNA polymerase sigma factor [Paenibacillus nanensis]|uniref:Sigma-70 family RNA polymerase sigma factor n=1 Tax=Paenibacillus nanensis TaxID=393251 RepID=A0A3A1UY61_9BACL|nr:sigma-70 family RNA polymerase sigma factor [Paenibacillus nanensis]RIX50260.1 sigma-70 family RNA polymerase sigma factor [Paenibacillus nanensis]
MDIAGDVKQAQKGNLHAFERLIQTNKLIMYQVAKTILTNDSDCADAIQEAILKAFEKIKTLREPGYFRTWLLRIVINECNYIHRQNKKVIEIHERMAPLTSSEENGYEKVELEQLLESLPSEEGSLLKLYHIEDISIKDLAEIYQKPENTIKTWLRRARENARSIWEEQEGYQWKSGSRN